MSIKIVLFKKGSQKSPVYYSEVLKCHNITTFFSKYADFNLEMSDLSFLTAALILNEIKLMLYLRFQLEKSHQ